MSINNLKINITISLTDQEAWDLAQYFKRVGFTDYRNSASNDAEAYRMLYAGEKIRNILAEFGYAPR